MKFSVAWLKEWVDVGLSTGELCDQLTRAGLEVEGVEPAGPAIAGVVAARVLDAKPHANAAALRLCRVDAGGNAPLTVVCGAPNVRAGGTHPLATVGATLPDGAKVRRRSIRGVASEGMLCSARELDLGEEAGGLMALPASTPIGVDLTTALALDDSVVDVNVTPNRGDCLSLRGLAREVAVLGDLAVRAPPCAPVPAVADVELPVAVEDGAGCPRYLGRVVAGVDMDRPAPLWLRERLRRCGLRSIDPVVDVTNYVMLELGQPMHAFDLATVDGGIVVRRARAGEELTLIDGRKVQVDDRVLLIADHRGPVAVAGVMGGRGTGVSAATRDVFLESAFFAPGVVAASARRFGIRSDAAHRYERGVDWALPAAAMERATQLLLDIVGGSPGPTVAVSSPAHLPTRTAVTLRRRRLDALVGERIAAAEVTGIFERLGFVPQVAGAGDALAWTVASPSHRFDIAQEEDLVEEVLRVHGYDAVASQVPPAKLALGAEAAGTVPAARLADRLAELGYAEAVTYSFVDPAVAAVLDPAGEPLRLANPISKDHGAMRTGLLAGLAAAARTNLSRQAQRVRLFEIGQCFRPGAEGIDATVLCGGIAIGPREQPSWAHPGAEVDFFDVKGDVERICALSGAEVGFAPATEDPILHPGQGALVTVAGSHAGRLGRLHPDVAEALDLPGAVFVFELAVAAVSVREPRRHRALSRQPAVRRDLALVVDEQVAAGRIETMVREALGDLVAELQVFDVYAGAGVPAGSKSVAIGIALRHASKTLEDAEVNRRMDELVATLGAGLGARLRE